MVPKYKRGALGHNNNMGDNSFVDDISYISTNWNGYRGKPKDKFPNFPSNNLISAQDKASINRNRKRKDIGYLAQHRNGEKHKADSSTHHLY